MFKEFSCGSRLCYRGSSLRSSDLFVHHLWWITYNKKRADLCLLWWTNYKHSTRQFNILSQIKWTFEGVLVEFKLSFKNVWKTVSSCHFYWGHIRLKWPDKLTHKENNSESHSKQGICDYMNLRHFLLASPMCSLNYTSKSLWNFWERELIYIKTSGQS